MWSEKWQIAKRTPYLDCNRSTRRGHRIRVPNRPTERQSPQKKRTAVSLQLAAVPESNCGVRRSVSAGRPAMFRGS